MNEDEYKKELLANGVQVPEITEEPAKEPEKEPVKEPIKEPEKTPEEPKIEPKEPVKELEDNKEPKKRSIYDEYKDKKSELKEEKEARLQAEKERDELKEALAKAKTPEEKKEALDDLDEFAKSSNLDPAGLKKMRDIFLKDLKVPGLSDEDRKILEDAKNFSNQNKEVVEKQQFEKEFTATIPTLKEFFPTASQEELNTVKVELDKIAHSEGWNDKSLDYIAFKHKDVLKELVSPKKRGLESKGNKQIDETVPTDFNPNADISKMSEAEFTTWNTKYQSMMKSEGLAEDSQGRKLLI